MAAVGALALGLPLGVTAQAQSSGQGGLLAGVELVTEQVEPGVHRIVSDGVRDLSVRLPSDAADEADRPTSRIAMGPRGRVWHFGPESFFRLGAKRTHDGRAWDSVAVDKKGTIWALSADGGLATFASGKWDLKARQVLGFDIHPDGSAFMLWEDLAGRIDWVGGLRARDWKDRWTRPRGTSRDLAGWAMVVDPRGASAGRGAYRGWLLQPVGVVDAWALNRSSGWTEGPVNLHGEVLSLDTGRDGTSWFLLRYDGEATVVDGRIVTAAPEHWVAKGAPVDPGPDEELWFEVPRASPDDREFTGGLVVAPDSSLWLPSDDGLARFDGRTWSWYLRGHHVDDVAIDEHGKAWVQAYAANTISTYVVDPGAAMDTG